MQTKLIHEAQGQRTFVLILDTGDEVMSALKRFAESERLDASRFTAIGALSDAMLGYFDWQQKDYRHIPVQEQVEVASFIGDIAKGERGDISVHAHVVLGRSDGSAMAGHLLEAHVRPTLEVMLTEVAAHLRKRHDPESGLALIDLGAAASRSAR
jgi:predicted DNA-binding protein with PD1-like motif